jgi:hypothetical protein
MHFPSYLPPENIFEEFVHSFSFYYTKKKVLRAGYLNRVSPSKSGLKSLFKKVALFYRFIMISLYRFTITTNKSQRVLRVMLNYC